MLKVRILGAVELEPNDGRPLTRGAKETLAYLALNPEAKRDRMAADLWPGSDLVPQGYNLRRALSELRKALGPEADRIATRAGGAVEFDRTGIDVDLFQFRAALSAGRYYELATFVSGLPLQGLTSEWAREAQAALREEVSHGFTIAAQHAAGLDRFAEAERHFREALRQTRKSPSLWHGLIRLHSEAGDLPSARRVLAESEAALETSTRLPNAFAPLPVPLGRFVGRADTLSQLAADFRDRRLVTLCGAGGLGKTRAALAFATSAGALFPDGAVFVELAGAASGATVKQTIARSLTNRNEGVETWPEAIERLSAGRILLVLDNVEHLGPAIAEIVSDLLTQAPNLRILVTSRTPLGLAMERRRRLPPLRPAEARELFTACASITDPRYVWSEESASLCEQLDGIPLAIELTAAQVGTIPLTALSVNLSRTLALDSLCEGRTERHRTMRAALQVSLESLPAPSRQAFGRLGLFIGGFTGPAARTVAEVVQNELTGLVNASLLEFDGLRYRMLEPVRQLAFEELSASGEMEEIRRRHAEWFAALALAAYDGPFPYDRHPRQFAAKRAELLCDAANLRSALSTLDREGPGDSEGALSIRLAQLWFRMIQPTDPEAKAWLARLEIAPTGEIASRPTAHWWLTVGIYSNWIAARERGVPLLSQLIPVAARLGYDDVVGYASLALRDAPIRDPYHDEESTGFRVAVRTFERLGREEEARHSRIEAYAFQTRNAPESTNREELQNLANESIARDEVRNVAIALRLLARGEKDWMLRRRLLIQAVDLQRAAGHWGEVHSLWELASATQELGSPAEAIDAWQEGVRRCEEFGFMGDLADHQLSLASAYLRNGQTPAMWRAMAQAVKSVRLLNRPEYLTLLLGQLADLMRLNREEESYRELVAYLRHTQAGGSPPINDKFVEVRRDIEASGLTASRFSNADEILDWAEVRAALENPP